MAKFEYLDCKHQELVGASLMEILLIGLGFLKHGYADQFIRNKVLQSNKTRFVEKLLQKLIHYDIGVHKLTPVVHLFGQ